MNTSLPSRRRASRPPRPSLALLTLWLVVAAATLALGCDEPEKALLSKAQTLGELRVIRRGVTVTPPGESTRAPFPRERLADGAVVKLEEASLAWLRRDGGATFLVRGPAELEMRAEHVSLKSGRVFADTPAESLARLETPSGGLTLTSVRASVDVSDHTEVYVLSGEVRANEQRARPGERMRLAGAKDEATATVEPVASWEDWTGGLATTDRVAAPAPYGVGTVGARRPGDQGSPRFPLAIQRLDVHVTVYQDFAITEVDQTFFNPSSDTVEGIYRFRAPDGATLHRFGVDREGGIVWGYVKEKKAAAKQYQAHVYEGSKEDPALLEWEAPGVYRARLYPVGPGESRQVVVRYAEWLGRTGERGQRRMYVYPMAAEGAEGSLPLVEEFTAVIDLEGAGAKDVRAGMNGQKRGERILFQKHDFVPRADLAVELYDAGLDKARGYRAPHSPDLATLPTSEREQARRRAEGEADYLLVPVRPTDLPEPPRGVDLAIVVDSSAATDAGSLLLARAATETLLTHLGPSDRAAVFAGDDALRPVDPARAELAAIDEAGRRELLLGLARLTRGGASDIGGVLSDAAAKLDPERSGAVIYIGDGRPTVGELGLTELSDRLSKLARPVRVFAIGIGDDADIALLTGIARGGFAAPVDDAYGAARAALNLFEMLERPAWLRAQIDLGPTVERIYPRELGAMLADQSLVVVGRVSDKTSPTSMRVTGAGGDKEVPLLVSPLADHGDLRRRWAEGRLAQMLREEAGHAAMVDLGAQQGIITPVTSLYVPTTGEMTAEDRRALRVSREDRLHELARRREELDAATADDAEDAEEESEGDGWFSLSRSAKSSSAPASAAADNKEGGTGTRAKGEEGSMGSDRAERRSRHAGGPPPAQKVAVAAATAMPEEAPAPEPAAAPDPAAVEKQDEAPKADVPASGKNEWGADIDGDRDGAPESEPIAPGSIGGKGQGYGSGGLALGRNDLGGDAAPPRRANKPADAIGELEQDKKGGEGLEFGDEGKSAARVQAQLLPDTGSSEATTITGEAADFGMIGLLVDEDRERSAPERSSVSVTIKTGDLTRTAAGCGAGARVPLYQRVALWRERLAGTGGNPVAVASVYRQALWLCEAPTWRERARLLSMSLDAIPSVSGRVALWRVMQGDLGAADALYRGILARVKTPAEKRELSQALGLRTIDPGLLEKTLDEADSPTALVRVLRDLVFEWPDDLELALRLMDALEDAGDDAGARALARSLRARPDADARVRTAVGELHLRLAARGKDAVAKASDEAEARRAFGEIVEFAPDDPVARRRLGDLLRAHGFYAEATRQYQTLAKLTPDDPSVALLLASAAEGLGKLEEAVQWTEKGGSAGAPDVTQGPAATARAFAATFLAWGKLDAIERGDDDELDKLAARHARVVAQGRLPQAKAGTARVTMTWAHPELHPTLWSNALGTTMPAPEGDVTLGLAQVVVPPRADARVEVRVEPSELASAARLGAEAVLTIVFDETGDTEKIVRVPVRFTRTDPPRRTYVIDANARTATLVAAPEEKP